MPKTRNVVSEVKAHLDEQIARWEDGDGASPSPLDQFDAAVDVLRFGFESEDEATFYFNEFYRRLDSAVTTMDTARLAVRVLRGF